MTGYVGCKGCGKESRGLYCPECNTSPRQGSASRAANRRQAPGVRAGEARQAPGVPAGEARLASDSGAGMDRLRTPASAGDVRLVLPWRMLVRDNEHYGLSRGRLVLTERYRKAKEAVYAEACNQWRGERPAFTHPVRLEAGIYFPDHTRERDPGNYRKMVTDALQGVVYPKDALVRDERWYDAGIDGENPRAELVISALPSTSKE